MSGPRRVGLIVPGSNVIEVVASVSLGISDNVEVGRLDPGQLIAHARRLDLADADAVVLSACVQMPSLPAIDAARREFQRPVLSAATATAAELPMLLSESSGITNGASSG